MLTAFGQTLHLCCLLAQRVMAVGPGCGVPILPLCSVPCGFGFPLPAVLPVAPRQLRSAIPAGAVRSGPNPALPGARCCEGCAGGEHSNRPFLGMLGSAGPVRCLRADPWPGVPHEQGCAPPAPQALPCRRLRPPGIRSNPSWWKGTSPFPF